MVWPRPSKLNASANARNRPSRVRRQKRRKKRQQVKKPRATAPDRKSYAVMRSFLPHFPDKAPDEGNDRRKRQGNAQQPQVDALRPNHQIEHECKVVERQEAEADRAPKQ